MYKSFEIRNFRGFRRFRIEGFQRVNLITGENNVGKTALLEALFIHCGAANIRLLFSVENFRGITQFEGGIGPASSGLFQAFDSTHEVVLNGIDKVDIERLCILKVVPAPITIGQNSGEESSASYGEALEITFVDSSRNLRVSSRARVTKEGLNLDPLPIPPLYQGVYVHTKGADHRVDAERFSNLAKNVGEEEQFVCALRIVEPSVKVIRLLSHGGMTMLHADVGMGRFLPLPYAGEGMVRLATILLAIASSRNGVVLIDEFENGIHYTVLSKIWEAVAEFAERWNAQVFATTHSGECVRAAHEVFSGREYVFQLYRLQRGKDGAVEARVFDREALDAALKSDLETR